MKDSSKSTTVLVINDSAERVAIPLRHPAVAGRTVRQAEASSRDQAAERAAEPAAEPVGASDADPTGEQVAEPSGDLPAEPAGELVAKPADELVDANGHATSASTRIARWAEAIRSRESGGEAKDAPLVIEPESAVRISRDQLALYATEPLVAAGRIRIVEEARPQPASAYRIVRNKTARRIGIKARDPESSAILVIAPFGKRRLPITVLETFNYEPWEQLNLIRVETERTGTGDTDSWWIAPISVAVYGWIVILVLQAWEISTVPFVGGDLSIWLLWPGVFLITLVVAFLWKSRRGQAVRDLVVQTVNLLVLLVLGPIGLPILVGLIFGGVLAGVDGIEFPNIPTALLGRGIQIVFVVILAMLPGLLYFQFERRQIGSLRTRFLRDIMLINPSIQTEDDAESMYASMIDEVSGAIGASNRQFAMFSTGRPILVSTLLITVGWIMALWPVGGIDAEFNPSDLLIPQATPMVYAFLGAYLFALNLLFRRYARGDLTPKAYSHVAIRIFSAVIIVWVVGQVFALFGGAEVATLTASESEATNDNVHILLLVAAFGIGIIPETGIAVIKDLTRKSPVGKRFPSLSVKHPVSDLGGVSLYDQARLLEEGVESVENLAHHNLIELMLQSGIPTPRLVDLMDQAILYLHVVDVVDEPSDDADESRQRRNGMHKLRSVGIRTATDLLRAVEAAQERAAGAHKRQQAEESELAAVAAGAAVEAGDNRPLEAAQKGRAAAEIDATQSALDGVMGLLDREADASPKRMQLVLDSVADDEWLEYVKNWRSLSRGGELITSPDTFYEVAAGTA